MPRSKIIKGINLSKPIPGSICRDCALIFGGIWPKGHLATQWSGKCATCGEEKACCDTTDWNFPGIKLKLFEREF